MLGAAGPVMPDPQPRPKIMREKLRLAAIVLITFPKLHPEKIKRVIRITASLAATMRAIG
jgi:hypothetical protein